MKRLWMFLALVMLVFPVLQAQNDFDATMKSARKLRDLYMETAALAKFEQALKIKPADYEALWNASFLYSRVGNRLSDDDTKTKYFRRAESLAKQAIEANPNDAEGYYVMSVAKGRIALIASAKERVASSTDIKDNVDHALLLDGKHAGAWHVLGRWNAKVSNLNFAEKAAANLLFGGLPEGASNENAVNAYLRAIELRPDYILYYYDLAETYFNMGKKDKCREYCQKVVSMKATTPDDPRTQAEAKALMARL